MLMRGKVLNGGDAAPGGETVLPSDVCSGERELWDGVMERRDVPTEGLGPRSWQSRVYLMQREGIIMERSRWSLTQHH
ncbi:hypothetical protein MHYP_G00230780 [Metynnis hypsauchen]